MLLQLQDEPDIAAWVTTRLAQGHKIMGMGHAVYKTMDPRARFLKAMVERLGRQLGEEHWYRLSSTIEETATREFVRRGKTTIRPNVDFYSAPVYHMMGIPGDLMTTIFAMSRVAGWCAHIIEEKFAEAQDKPALYRPEAEYVGDYCGELGCSYQPITARD
jgi:citrate synthase